MIEVWGIQLDGILWYCVSGSSLFLGALLLIMAVTTSLFPLKKWHNILVYFVAIFAVLLIYMAAVPFSNFFYLAWAVSILIWLVCLMLRIQAKSKITIAVCLVAVVMALLAVLMELPHHIMPSIPSQGHSRLFVIGDSISAGIGTAEERTWPKIVSEKGLEVVDASIAGATVPSALRRQIQKITPDYGIVLLEIGGNDVFMGTSHEEFEKALRNILAKIVTDQHTVIMLEVPVLPWQVKYNRIQRKVANEFNVTVIPKKFLAGIFSAKGATVDLAHLSANGHELMAHKIWSLIYQSTQTKKMLTKPVSGNQ
ncbi:MAG: hypothetical protein FVQ79_03460 [Planctomycetes bacterium]|nr:hypothetical protein [Planctomycetota bacterium]